MDVNPLEAAITLQAYAAREGNMLMVLTIAILIVAIVGPKEIIQWIRSLFLMKG